MRGMAFLPGVFLCINLFAQSGSLDESFRFGLDTNFFVRLISEQSDGKLLVMGTSGDLYALRWSIVRLNRDGSLDQKFRTVQWESNEVTHPYLTAMRQRSDGKIIVTGGFESYRGHPRTNILLLSRHGRLLPKIFPRIGPIAGIRSNGSVLFVGGNPHVRDGGSLRLMSPKGEISTNFLLLTARWEYPSQPVIGPDDSACGVIDSFRYANYMTYFISRDGTVQTGNIFQTAGYIGVANPGDGTFYAYGRGTFLQWNWENGRSVSRTNWLIWRRGPPGSFASFSYYPTNVLSEGIDNFTIAAQPDGKVLIVAWYHEFAASVQDETTPTIFRFQRLNTDGSLDETFTPPSPIGLQPNWVFRMLVLRDGKILLYGPPLEFSGRRPATIVRLLP